MLNTATSPPRSAPRSRRSTARPTSRRSRRRPASIPPTSSRSRGGWSCSGSRPRGVPTAGLEESTALVGETDLAIDRERVRARWELVDRGRLLRAARGAPRRDRVRDPPRVPVGSPRLRVGLLSRRPAPRARARARRHRDRARRSVPRAARRSAARVDLSRRTWWTEDRPVRVVFMGSPEFAVPCLRALAAAHEVALVVSQPDKPAGRGGELARARGQARRAGARAAGDPAGVGADRRARATRCRGQRRRARRRRRVRQDPAGGRCSTRYRAAASTSTPRCCRSTAAPRRCSGR